MLRIYDVIDKIPKDIKNKFQGLPDYIIKFLLNRGIASYEEYEDRYLQSQLEDPGLLMDVKAGFKFLTKQINDRRNIVIYGDYDADGIISAYILYDFIKNILGYSNVAVWLPNRFTDGYGLNAKLLDKIHKFADTVITVDCGIRDVALIRKFSNKLQFMIIDHHELPKKLPQVPIIHPRHPKGENKNKVTSAGITVFKFVSYVANRLAKDPTILHIPEIKGNLIKFKDLSFIDKHLQQYLDVASITIATDVMPVLGENRLLVKLAINYIRNNANTGVNTGNRSITQKLLSFLQRNIADVTFNDFGFLIGPRLNATGRLYDPSLGLSLLINVDENIFKSVNSINEQRKNLINIDQHEFEFSTLVNNFIVVYDTRLSEGIIGLVAARLVKMFGLPSIVITKTEDNKLKGSARSIASINITQVFENMSDVFEKFGGHSAAAGFTLAESLENFVKVLNNIRIDKIPAQDFVADDLVDVGDLTLDFVKNIKSLEPFGPSNEQFVLIVRGIIEQIGITPKGKIVVLLSDVKNGNKKIKAYMSQDLFKSKLQIKLTPGITYYFVVRIFGQDINYSLWVEDIADSVNFLEVDS